jgi:uncharacterized protein YqeY
MQDKIKELLKQSMLAKDSAKTLVYRNISAAFTTERTSEARIANGLSVDTPLTEDECLKVIKKLVKQRRDSIEQFVSGGREDLAEDERFELSILTELLPPQMSSQEITDYISKKIQIQKPDNEEKNKWIGMTIKELGDKAAGSLIKTIAEELLK